MDQAIRKFVKKNVGQILRASLVFSAYAIEDCCIRKPFDNMFSKRSLPATLLSNAKYPQRVHKSSQAKAMFLYKIIFRTGLDS